MKERVELLVSISACTNDEIVRRLKDVCAEIEAADLQQRESAEGESDTYTTHWKIQHGLKWHPMTLRALGSANT